MAWTEFSREIKRELDAITADRVVIAAVRTVAHGDEATKIALRLQFVEGELAALAPCPPPRELGRYALRNLDGWQERRTDLPKEDRDISHWAPSWHGNDSHLVTRTVKAYPIVNHAARLLTVSTRVIEQLNGAAIVRARVDQPLDRASPSFAENLRFNLRLLREFCGDAQVYSADMTDAEYATVQHVAWELLPPGALDRVIESIGTRPAADIERIAVAEERLRALDRLKPDGFIQGRGRFSSYFGAMFGDKVVALENIEYGNALYVFETDWQRLTQLSRTELVKRRDRGVHRVQHRAGWQRVVRSLLRSARTQ